MYLKKIYFIGWITAILVFIWIFPLLAKVEYQHRGNRFEGVKDRPVSGYRIELISALMDYRENTQRLPDQFKIKFYLEKQFEIHITARELDYKYFYWMDKVESMRPWQPGFVNDFAWPTKDVIQQLPGLRMYDLGVVVRKERSEPGRVERVAPAIFYYAQFPSSIKGYLFTFKTNGEAQVSCSVYQDGKTVPVFIQLPRKVPHTIPFTVKWTSGEAPRGLYKLLVKGYFLDNNDPIDQIVYFYHQPAVKP